MHNSLAESSAFILENTAQSRLKIVKKIKKLYGKRSSIAHGGSNSVSSEEICEAFLLVKSLVDKMLLDPQLSKLENIEDLIEWINAMKYS